MSKKAIAAAAIAVGAVGIVAAGVVVGIKYLKKSCSGLNFDDADFGVEPPKAPIAPECEHFEECTEDCAECTEQA